MMAEDTSRYTAEHTAKELELVNLSLKRESEQRLRDLANQIEINIILLRELREIKRTFWYRVGKLLCLIP
jgi:hypothetical protein